MSVIDFFDLNLRSWREFRYYRTKIEAFPADPSLVGCEALLEVGNVDVIWQPSRVLGRPVQRVDAIAATERLSEG